MFLPIETARQIPPNTTYFILIHHCIGYMSGSKIYAKDAAVPAQAYNIVHYSLWKAFSGITVVLQNALHHGSVRTQTDLFCLYGNGRFLAK